MATVQELVETMVRAKGVLGATRECDWTAHNGASTWTKTTPEVRVVWDNCMLMIETLDKSVYVCLSMDDYGHLSWWKDAQKALYLQVKAAWMQEDVDQLIVFARMACL